MMQLGQSIKSLRKAQDITQEKLADALNISHQAISRWENGTALPDITFLIPLANFFGVSVDMLLGHKQADNEAEIEKVFDASKEKMAAADLPAAAAILRDALKTHPRNTKLMCLLATVLWLQAMRQDNVTAFADEMIALCETILEDSRNDWERYRAIQLLCAALPRVGQYDRAVALAKTMPGIDSCADMLLRDIYEGDEQAKQLQRNIMTLLDALCGTMIELASQPRGRTPAERYRYFKTPISLIELICYDGNCMGLFGLAGKHCNCAWMASCNNDYAAALEHLLQAEKHMLAEEALGERRPYTGIFLDMLEYDSVLHVHGTPREILIQHLAYDDYAPLAGNAEFEALRTRLGVV